MSQPVTTTTTYVDINDSIEQTRPNVSGKQANDFVGPKKGNFLYNKCYICISIFKWFPVIFILAITIWSYYAYVLQLCLFTIESLATKTFYIIIFNILYFMTLWSYMQTVITKSSLAPVAFRLTNADYERIVKETTDEKRNQVLFEIAKERQLPLACRTYSGAVRLCSKCNVIKPDRAHHCSVCNACILKMDHHCPWVNNCVSFSNYKFFILFLAYSFLMCLFGAITSFPYFLEFWTNQNPTLGKFNILFLFFVAFMFSISLFSLLSYHIYLVLRNLSTLENFRSPLFAYGPNKNAFNLGKLNNFKEVFGQKKLFWFLPIYTSCGNGVSFKKIYQFYSDEDMEYHDNQPLLNDQDDMNELGSLNQNDDQNKFEKSIKTDNLTKKVEQKSETKKKVSFDFFGCLCCSRSKQRIEDNIDVNLELFDDKKMNNPFKSNKDDQSNTSSTSNLSTNQLVIKPIKSLTSNATGSGRNKVELKPGHSLMDWVRLTNSGQDLTCNSFAQRKVTGAELAKHNKIKDAWTSIEGNVFNITPYFDFHPGGADQLLRAAGKESTKLFKQVHAWVNWSSLLQKCKIGFLIPDEDVLIAELDEPEEKKDVKNDIKEETQKDVKNDENFVDPNFIVLNETDSLYQININMRFDLDQPINKLSEYQIVDNQFVSCYWIDDMKVFDLFFQLEKPVKEEDLMIDITEEKRIKVKIYQPNKIFYIFNCRLPSAVKQKFEFNQLENNRIIKITLTKFQEELWAGQISRENYQFELTSESLSNAFYRKVTLIDKRSLTHDVFLFLFKMPDGIFIPCKFGNHVSLKMKIKNETIHRYYTVVPQCFVDRSDQTNTCYEDKVTFCFIIKIYKDGRFTSKLNELKIGKKIEMSDVFSIDFEIQKVLANRTTVYLLAAGTGITPMLSVLFLAKLNFINEKLTSDKEIKLIFCNKTEEDIILKEEFDRLNEESISLGCKFSYLNILSQADSKWPGLKGRISNELILEHVKFNKDSFLFICGPTEYNLSVLNILDTLYNLKEESYFVFSG